MSASPAWPLSGLTAAACVLLPVQEKKEAEERRKKELAELFAQAIKQPKVPAGEEKEH